MQNSIKPSKYSHRETNKVELGTKIIYQYPTPTKSLGIARMVVDGRHPNDKSTFIIEHKCQFVIYITKGTGVIYAGDEEFPVGVGDVVFVPVENRFAVEGKMEYITVDNPAFFPEQVDEIKVHD